MKRPIQYPLHFFSEVTSLRADDVLNPYKEKAGTKGFAIYETEDIDGELAKFTR